MKESILFMMFLIVIGILSCQYVDRVKGWARAAVPKQEISEVYIWPETSVEVHSIEEFVED